MNRRRLLAKLRQGHLQNVVFQDFVELVKGYGFQKVRQEGSHRAFAHIQVQEILNLQPVNGEAKPYQIRQFLHLVEKYNLQLEHGA